MCSWLRIKKSSVLRALADWQATKLHVQCLSLTLWRWFAWIRLDITGLQNKTRPLHWINQVETVTRTAALGIVFCQFSLETRAPSKTKEQCWHWHWIQTLGHQEEACTANKWLASDDAEATLAAWGCHWANDMASLTVQVVHHLSSADGTAPFLHLLHLLHLSVAV